MIVDSKCGRKCVCMIFSVCIDVILCPLFIRPSKTIRIMWSHFRHYLIPFVVYKWMDPLKLWLLSCQYILFRYIKTCFWEPMCLNTNNCTYLIKLYFIEIYTTLYCCPYSWIAVFYTLNRQSSFHRRMNIICHQ